jgi:hypothetical protein
MSVGIESRAPSFLLLTLGWALLSFNSIVLGCTISFSLRAVSASFDSPVMSILFAFYIWFGAPLLIAAAGFVFARSIFVENRGVARVGLVASLGVLGLWGTMLAIQFAFNSRW